MEKLTTSTGFVVTSLQQFFCLILSLFLVPIFRQTSFNNNDFIMKRLITIDKKS